MREYLPKPEPTNTAPAKLQKTSQTPRTKSKQIQCKNRTILSQSGTPPDQIAPRVPLHLHICLLVIAQMPDDLRECLDESHFVPPIHRDCEIPSHNMILHLPFESGSVEHSVLPLAVVPRAKIEPDCVNGYVILFPASPRMPVWPIDIVVDTRDGILDNRAAGKANLAVCVTHALKNC